MIIVAIMMGYLLAGFHVQKSSRRDGSDELMSDRNKVYPLAARDSAGEARLAFRQTSRHRPLGHFAYATAKRLDIPPRSRQQTHNDRLCLHEKSQRNRLHTRPPSAKDRPSSLNDRAKRHASRLRQNRKGRRGR